MNNQHSSLPVSIPPILPTSVGQPFDSDHHSFEVKWDGIHCLAFKNQERVRLRSREVTDITAPFPELQVMRDLPDGTVLDGELIILVEDRLSLSLALQRMQTTSMARINHMSTFHRCRYVVFDFLYQERKPVMRLPLRERQALLREILKPLPKGIVRANELVVGRGQEPFQIVQPSGEDGKGSLQRIRGVCICPGGAAMPG